MDWNLISIGEAAKLIGVHPNTLRNHELPGGEWAEVLGLRIRVYHFKSGQRRYDRTQILQQIYRLMQAR